MARRRRKSPFARLGRVGRRRLTATALVVVSLALLMLPPSVTQAVRLHAGPVFYPLEGLTRGLMLDLRRPPDADGPPGRAPGEAARLRREKQDLEEALVKATATVYRQQRRIEELTQIRQGLRGLPCRLVPAGVLPVRLGSGRAEAALGAGTDDGIRAGDVVLERHIDRGTRQALERGQAVLSAVGLVGLVDAVGPRMSTVRFLTDPRSRIMVRVITRRKDTWRAGPTGVAVGMRGGRRLKVKGLSRSADVAEGDYVVTSPSAHSPVPPYLIVGRIVRCELKPAAVFYTVEAEPRLAPDAVEQVYVLVPAPQAKP